ncbi:MAG TPA: hypothetical protein VIE44_19810 [Methylomirabilota bacterium]|jgi:hypothetical protein
MNSRRGTLVTLASLTLADGWSRSSAFAQGLPAPGPGGAALPSADGGSLLVPALILAVALLGALILAVVVVDLRRKRRAQAIAIEGQIADALMREPRLSRTVITTVAQVPLTGRAGPTVEVRGEVEYPELRETAVRIVRQELLRHHPEGRVEDRIFVAPPVPVARH